MSKVMNTSTDRCSARSHRCRLTALTACHWSSLTVHKKQRSQPAQSISICTISEGTETYNEMGENIFRSLRAILELKFTRSGRSTQSGRCKGYQGEYAGQAGQIHIRGEELVWQSISVLLTGLLYCLLDNMVRRASAFQLKKLR